MQKRRVSVVVCLLSALAACSAGNDEGSVSSTNQALECSGLPAWSLHPYVGGDRVKSVGNAYQCKPFPFSGWCGVAAAYEPGVGFAWQDAWTLVDSCSTGSGGSSGTGGASGGGGASAGHGGSGGAAAGAGGAGAGGTGAGGTGGAADADHDGLADSVETNTGVFVSPTNTGTNPNNADTDGDGISDGDETLGTSAGLNLPALGANPLRKNVFIEYDWFNDSLECGAHSHRPTPAAISQLNQAFANAPVSNPDHSTGVTLINDFGQGGAFSGGNLVADADGVIAGAVFDSDYLTYRAQNFASNRVGFFHYALLPHRYDTNSSSSGYAAIVGDSLIVSLYCANSDVNVADTIMHELGHNLGLRHGGDEDTNFKPNYNSVMNYAFQFSGVDTDCSQFGDMLLDYSRNRRITLNENALSEPAGTCGNVAIDWNFSGTIDQGLLQLDLNADSLFSSLHDYDDWAHLVYRWQSNGALKNGVRQAVRCDNPAPIR